MILLPDDIKARLPRLYSQDGRGEDVPVIVKYFAPCGAATWLVTEGEYDAELDTWVFFGWVTLWGDFWECGGFTLSELEEVELPYRLRIERDLHLSEGVTVRQLIRRQE